MIKTVTRTPEFVRFMRRCGFTLERNSQMASTSRFWESLKLHQRAKDTD